MELRYEEGTHKDLLSIPDGMYHNLVEAQHLKAGAASDIDDVGDTEPIKEIKGTEKTISEIVQVDNGARKPRTKYGAIGRILYEQRTLWPFYVVIILTTMSCGGK
jgi:hypothetical protein